MEEKKEEKVENKEVKKSNNSCLIIVIAVVVLIVLMVGSIFVKYWIGQWSSKKSGTTSTTTTDGGNWTLEMTQNTTMTGPQTEITTTGKGTINLTIPSGGGKVTASGAWSSEGTGTVAMSNETSELKGKINIDGEAKNDKLHFTISYTEDSCIATVSTPIGGNVTTDCMEGNVPDQHVIDIDIRDGATASSTLSHNYSGYVYTGTESWKLTKTK